MQAVILAAGKGTRLAHLTRETPKPLVPVLGKSILERILASLPDAIADIIVITQYREEQIHSFCAEHPRAKDIACVSQGAMSGTYGALASAKDRLASPFLIIGGDDIHSKKDLERLTSHPRAFGVAKRRSHGYHAIETDSKGIVIGMHPQTETEQNEGALLATGAYMLDAGFFSLPPAQLKNGEYGIPHTLIREKDRYPLPAIDMPDWVTINTPEDLKEAEKSLILL